MYRIYIDRVRRVTNYFWWMKYMCIFYRWFMGYAWTMSTALKSHGLRAQLGGHFVVKRHKVYQIYTWNQHEELIQKSVTIYPAPPLLRKWFLGPFVAASAVSLGTWKWLVFFTGFHGSCQLILRLVFILCSSRIIFFQTVGKYMYKCESLIHRGRKLEVVTSRSVFQLMSIRG